MKLNQEQTYFLREATGLGKYTPPPHSVMTKLSEQGEAPPKKNINAIEREVGHFVVRMIPTKSGCQIWLLENLEGWHQRTIGRWSAAYREECRPKFNQVIETVTEYQKSPETVELNLLIRNQKREETRVQRLQEKAKPATPAPAPKAIEPPPKKWDKKPWYKAPQCKCKE